MKVLPVSGICYRGKASDKQPAQKARPQSRVAALPKNLNIKRGGAVSTAAIFGTIYGGTALLFAAPAAVIVGVAIIGALSGAALAEEEKPADKLNRYKYYA